MLKIDKRCHWQIMDVVYKLTKRLLVMFIILKRVQTCYSSNKCQFMLMRKKLTRDFVEHSDILFPKLSQIPNLSSAVGLG